MIAILDRGSMSRMLFSDPPRNLLYGVDARSCHQYICTKYLIKEVTSDIAALRVGFNLWVGF